MLKKEDGRAWTSLMWLRVGTSGWGLLNMGCTLGSIKYKEFVK